MQQPIFIYKDSLGKFNTATNVYFIAKHKQCRAIQENELLGNKYYSTISDFLYALNNNKHKAKQIAETTVLIELL